MFDSITACRARAREKPETPRRQNGASTRRWAWVFGGPLHPHRKGVGNSRGGAYWEQCTSCRQLDANRPGISYWTHRLQRNDDVRAQRASAINGPCSDSDGQLRRKGVELVARSAQAKDPRRVGDQGPRPQRIPAELVLCGPVCRKIAATWCVGDQVAAISLRERQLARFSLQGRPDAGAAP